MNEIEKYIVNSVFSRTIYGTPLLDGKGLDRNIDEECGYPDAISTLDYLQMYQRGDVAARVVDIEAKACWEEYPEVFETEEERETQFERALDNVIARTNLYSYLARADQISGIGRFGVLFLGFDDGKEFFEPAPGFSEEGPLAKPGKSEILYYRVLDESCVTIGEFENDRSNPRYGHPKYYTLIFQEYPSDLETATVTSMRVHWSRVIHIADNLTTSELYGQPRMESVWNRLMDLRKINGGSAEMFWRGGFPGLSFEVDPKAGEFSEEDKEALRDDIKLYADGLQRYLTTIGVKVQSLNTQVADPSSHVNNNLQLISTAKAIPFQIFTGTQQGRSDSSQDTINWEKRIARRRNMYVTPFLIRPAIDRLIQAGALPQPLENPEKINQYTVKWTPLAKLTETERAEVGKNLTEALARYATAGAEALVPLPEFLAKFLGFSFQQVEAIGNAPPTELSVVLQQLKAGMAAGSTGTESGNVPTSIPKMANTKDPTKTPQNMVQPKKEDTATNPAPVQE